jgi:hypothetical protein
MIIVAKGTKEAVITRAEKEITVARAKIKETIIIVAHKGAARLSLGIMKEFAVPHKVFWLTSSYSSLLSERIRIVRMCIDFMYKESAKVIASC